MNILSDSLKRLALALSLASPTVFAQPVFDAPANGFRGEVVSRGQNVVPGSDAEVIELRLAQHGNQKNYDELIKIPQLTECHRVTGDPCVIMQAAVGSMPSMAWVAPPGGGTSVPMT